MKLVLQNVIKLAKGSLNNISQDSFNTRNILSQQSTHDRSYISEAKLYLEAQTYQKREGTATGNNGK